MRRLSIISDLTERASRTSSSALFVIFMIILVLILFSLPAWAVDIDGDGVDAGDAAECNNQIALATYDPSESSWRTRQYEDQWPNKGDWDFNDIDFHYRVARFFHANGNLKEILITISPAAAGQLNEMSLGFQQVGVPPTHLKREDPTSCASENNEVDCNSNGDSGSCTWDSGPGACMASNNTTASDAIFVMVEGYAPHYPVAEASITNDLVIQELLPGAMLFRDLFNIPNDTVYANTDASEDISNHRVIEIRIQYQSGGTPNLKSDGSGSADGASEVDVFPYFSNNFSRQIHLQGVAPTEGVSLLGESGTIFGTGDDDSTLEDTYQTNGHPWALDLADRTDWPLERGDVNLAFPDLESHVSDREDVTHQDWYLREKQDTSRIFSKGKNDELPPGPRSLICYDAILACPSAVMEACGGISSHTCTSEETITQNTTYFNLYIEAGCVLTIGEDVRVNVTGTMRVAGEVDGEGEIHADSMILDGGDVKVSSSAKEIEVEEGSFLRGPAKAAIINVNDGKTLRIYSKLEANTAIIQQNAVVEIEDEGEMQVSHVTVSGEINTSGSGKLTVIDYGSLTIDDWDWQIGTHVVVLGTTYLNGGSLAIANDASSFTTEYLVATAGTIDNSNGGIFKVNQSTTIDGDVTMRGPFQLDDVLVSSGSSILSGIFTMDDFVMEAGSTIGHEVGDEDGFTAIATNMDIRTDATIDVGAKGWPGGNRLEDGTGPGKGSTSVDNAGGGGGHGGPGGKGEIGGAGGDVYGQEMDASDAIHSFLTPIELGSGGGGGQRGKGGNGGGRIRFSATTINIDGALKAGGERAEEASSNESGGGGSGGSILIETDILSGDGTMAANGGKGGYATAERDGGSGGGGRIAVYYETSTATIVPTATGGEKVGNGEKGGDGSVLLQETGNLIVAANTSHTISDSKTYDDVTCEKGSTLTIADGGTLTATTLAIETGTDSYDNKAVVTIESGGAINATTLAFEGGKLNNRRDAYGDANCQTNSECGAGGTCDSYGYCSSGLSELTQGLIFSTVTVENTPILNGRILVSGTMTVKADATLSSDNNSKYADGSTLLHDDTIGGSPTVVNWIEVVANKLVVEEDGSIDLSNKGWAGGATKTKGNGPGHGKGSVERAGGGAGHGGAGGKGETGGAGGDVYGDTFDDNDDVHSYLTPIQPGSGGGGGQHGKGGKGGGAFKINVNTLELDGALNVNGEKAPNVDSRDAGGGGAGGSIYIRCSDTWSGDGTITATGGKGDESAKDGGSGGGGYIAIYYGSKTATTTPTANGGAKAGSGGEAGEDGLVCENGTCL